LICQHIVTSMPVDNGESISLNDGDKESLENYNSNLNIGNRGDNQRHKREEYSQDETNENDDLHEDEVC
ncbi:unnamed protein product, partial [Didymodactylos carnosus]